MQMQLSQGAEVSSYTERSKNGNTSTDCHVGVNVMLLIKYNISNNLMHNTDPLLKFKGPSTNLLLLFF